VSRSKKNKEQWSIIISSLFIQVVILSLLSFFYERIDFEIVIRVSIFMYLVYYFGWWILRWDLMSKIFTSKAVSWIIVLTLVYIFFTGLDSGYGFIFSTAISLSIGLVYITLLIIAENELGILDPESSPPPCKVLTPLPSPLPSPIIMKQKFKFPE